MFFDDMEFDAVILGDGDFPQYSVPLEILRNASYLCCCDGAGYNLITVHGMMPDAIVGDGDSMPAEFKKQHRDIIHIVDEQEDNDLTKATRHCLALGFRRIAYLGTTGKREDHTLGNISLLERYVYEMDVDATLITDYGYFVVTEGDTVMHTFPGQQVSIFNISCTRIKSKGLKWDTYAYRSSWQGTLNEATGDSVTLETDGWTMVFRTFLAKKI